MAPRACSYARVWREVGASAFSEWACDLAHALAYPNSCLHLVCRNPWVYTYFCAHDLEDVLTLESVRSCVCTAWLIRVWGARTCVCTNLRMCTDTCIHEPSVCTNLCPPGDMHRPGVQGLPAPSLGHLREPSRLWLVLDSFALAEFTCKAQPSAHYPGLFLPLLLSFPPAHLDAFCGPNSALGAKVTLHG